MTQPNDREAEDALLGSMLWEKSAIETASALVEPGDFYHEPNRLIFKAIVEVGEPDPILVASHLKTAGLLEKIDGQANLILLRDNAVPGHVEHYAEIVSSCARRSDAIDNAYMIAKVAELGEDYEPFLKAIQETSTKSSRPRLVTVTAYELQRMEFPPLEYVVQDLLPAGLCFFAGAFKAGKSYMGLQLGLAVARGDDFLNLPTTQGEALLVAVEDGFRRLQGRIGQLCSEGWPDTLHLAESIPRLDAGGIEELERFKQEHTDLQLIVLDVWQRVRGKERSRNPYADDYGAIEDIQSFASDNDIAVLILHHHRKAKDDDPFNQFSGSTGIMGASDTLWTLERERGQCDASFRTTGRDIQALELALHFNELSCEWTALGPLGEVQMSAERLEIFDLLREEGPMRAKDIIDALPHKKENTVRAQLRKMVEAGELTQPGRGLFAPKEG